MSFFDEGFVCELTETGKKQSFAGTHTSMPVKYTSAIQFDENQAYELLSAHVKKHEALWVPFYVTNGIEISNSKIKAIQAKIDTAVKRRAAYAIKHLTQALTYTTRTCPHCDRKVYMKHYESTLRWWQNNQTAEYGVVMSCKECGSRDALPFTKPQRTKLESYSAQIATLRTERLDAKLAQCAKLHKQKKLAVKALVLGLLHESLEDEYRDDY